MRYIQRNHIIIHDHIAWFTHSSSDPQPYNSESKECPFGNDANCGCPFRHSQDIDEYIIPRTPRTQQTHQSAKFSSSLTAPPPKVILTVSPKSPKPPSTTCWYFRI